MDHFLRILGRADLSCTPLVLDLELDHGQTRGRITAATRACCEILQSRTGRIPILYSRAGWVNQYLAVDDLPPVHWWLAQYRWSLPYPFYTPEHPCPPVLPTGVSTWLAHQTACRGASIGAKAAYFMDYNRWNGTRADVFDFIGQPQKPVICPLDGEICPVKHTLVGE